MQAALADVEISASRGTHFFGQEHSAALEELRNSQILLAQAWARSEGEDVGIGNLSSGSTKGGTHIPPKSSASSGKSPRASIDRGDKKRGENGTSGKSASGAHGHDTEGMEGGGEDDVETARMRREANDRYFERIREGVRDVVGRLEGVAEAMGKVERESREIWSDSDSEGLDSGGDE